MRSISFYLFRFDLRIRDNSALIAAVQRSKKEDYFIPIYCFDDKTNSQTPFSATKSSPERTQFLIESVASLKGGMSSSGTQLMVGVGDTAEYLSGLLSKVQDSGEELGDIKVFCQEEFCGEELKVNRSVERAIKAFNQKRGHPNPTDGSSIVTSIWGSSLYELEDAPFDANSAPTVMTQFRTKMEKNCAIPNCVETFGRGHVCGGIPEALKGEGDKELPGLKDLGFDETELSQPDERAAFNFKGGEENALARVQEYIFDLDLLKTYFETRNGLIGANFSTKFSPFLAVGSVSPRYIAHQCKKYEAERVANKSTYWVIFELTVRDFCRYFAKRFGDKIFQLDGILGREARGRHPNSIRWSYNPTLVEAWKEGTTGYPFVDANMRELKATGYMSNRGRQNVASFLALDMNQDWRYGGYWFEEKLLDYDIYSNYVSWIMAAGMTGGRVNKFNVVKQGKDYDPKGEYVKLWCPELENVPVGKIMEPWRMSKDEQKEAGCILGVNYPNPVVQMKVFQKRDGGGKDGYKAERKKKNKEKYKGGKYSIRE
ncbi:hypothetical protein TrCOL_g6689 [Triparma columacea]|nr:hypothetical protein TrCOL_g6689 [Triparma columacea]